MKRPDLFSCCMILIVGAMWGLHGPAIKLAYKAGFTFPQVVLFEYAVGGLVFGGVVLLQNRTLPKSNPRFWATMVLAALEGCSVPLFLFWAYDLGPVSIAATVFFLYVPLTQLLNLILTGRLPCRRELASMVLVVGGAAISSEVLGSAHLQNLRGVPCALLAALGFASFFVTTSRLGEEATPAFRSFFFSLVACPIVLAASFAAGWPLVPHVSLVPALSWILVLGVGGQVIPVFLLVRFVPRTGSGLGSILASLELPVAVATSALILGDPLGKAQVLGVLLVLAGIALPNLPRSTSTAARAA